MKNFEIEIPSNYKLVKILDAKQKKLALSLTLWSLLILAVIVAGVVVLTITLRSDMNTFSIGKFTISFLIFFVVYLVYIVLHEITHGVAYYAMTKCKLKFGMTLTVAYCGVPNIYVYRRTALISLYAPLILYLVILLPLFILSFFFFSCYATFCIGFMLATHLSGCIGDMYIIHLLNTKFKSPKLLMNDTGPKQTFYLPIEEIDDLKFINENLEEVNNENEDGNKLEKGE